MISTLLKGWLKPIGKDTKGKFQGNGAVSSLTGKIDDDSQHTILSGENSGHKCDK